MRFVGRGHPAVRATHAKTLELVAGDDLTERGTCVIAVGADAEPAAPLAGPVRLRIAAGGHRSSVDALANPAWDPAGPVVVRRGPLRLPGTFATDADAAAADLPRELVAALADPDVLVTVDVAPVPGPPVMVLVAADPLATVPSPALAAELDRADRVVVEDVDARRLAGPSRGTPGGRTVVVATRDLPGASVVDTLGEDVDVLGLPPVLAAAAACPSRAPLVVADADALGTAPATARLALTAARKDLPALLVRAAEVRGSSAATVVQDHGRPVRATADDVPDLPGADVVAVCLHPTAGSDAIDPGVRAAVTGLLADGVPTKTAARALAALTGWDRRRAYDTVLALGR